MKLFLYFSQTIGLDILDSKGEWIGRLHDIAMNPTSDIYPKASELIIRRGSYPKEYAKVTWEDILYFDEEIRLKLNGNHSFRIEHLNLSGFSALSLKLQRLR